MTTPAPPPAEGRDGFGGEAGSGWVVLGDGRRGRWYDDGGGDLVGGRDAAPALALAQLPAGAEVVRSGAVFEEVRAHTLAAAPWPQRLRRRLLGDPVGPAAEYVVLLPPR